MEEEESEEPTTISDNGDSDLKQKLEKLNEYVKQMSYKPVEPPKLSERMEYIAKANKRYLVSSYSENKDSWQPKERAERMKRIVQGHTPMTIDNFEKFIKNYRKKQVQKEKIKKLQESRYHETLSKLQKQCEKEFVNTLVHKFAEFVSQKASSIKTSSVWLASSSKIETESYQRLQNSLFCEMIFSLQIPNNQQTKDLGIYKKLAKVLADLILHAIFLAHNSNNEEKKCPDDEIEQLGDSTAVDQEIRLRALRAAKKKFNNQIRKKRSKRFATLSLCMNKQKH